MGSKQEVAPWQQIEIEILVVMMQPVMSDYPANSGTSHQKSGEPGRICSLLIRHVHQGVKVHAEQRRQQQHTACSDGNSRVQKKNWSDDGQWQSHKEWKT